MSAPAPYDQKTADEEGSQLVIVDKAYKNEDFLMSREARSIRILCEFEETLARLRKNGVLGTFLFFGSARAMFRPDWDREVARLDQKLADANSTEKEKAEAHTKRERLEKTEWLCEYMEKCELLSTKLTEWSLSEKMTKINESGVHPGGHSLRQSDPTYLCERDGIQCMQEGHKQKYCVATGGGPGLMEAANRGAHKVPGARSAGFAISLPFEKGLNPFVSPDLAFTFHYFFTRKYWMMYPAKVLIAMPGGFGTFDELFESVTLKQTGKKPPFPVVLIGKHYWETVINWTELVRVGTISAADKEHLFMTDSVDEAFAYIKEQLIISAPPGSPIKRCPPAPLFPDVPPAAKKRKTERELTPETPFPPPGASDVILPARELPSK
ncbi:hypothetical protein DIPPA_08937 [Diplonema papillatum]|nr:hypothetical protein DIPPA_08937 [Diplonema papillatum]